MLLILQELSVKDMTDKTEWVKSGEDWYLYVDGELVKENYYEYSGKTYYFDQEGRMETGIFENKTGKRCMAEPSGAVITNPTKGWNKSSEADIWYYYKSNAEGDLYPVDNEILNLQGKKYYIDWNGRMILVRSIMMDPLILQILMEKYRKKHLGI